MAVFGRKKDQAGISIPKGGDELVQWVNKQWDKGHRLDEFIAKQNLAFVLGNQWGVWDRTRKRFQTADSHRGDPNAPVRVTVNKVGSLTERVIARLTKDLPIPEARPVTDTESDVSTAKVATRILSHEMDRLDFIQRTTELLFWVVPLGWSFFHVRWDPNQGSVVGTLEDEQIRQGEVMLEEVPAFELRIDPNARRFRDARWVIREVAMTKEAVYEQYGVIPEVSDSDTIGNEWRMMRSAGDDGMPRSKSSKEQSHVSVRQLWLKPGGRIRPEGLVVTFAGNTILEEPAPFPYEHGELPFIPFNLLPAVGGDPAGRTWVTDLIPMQRDYNDARSREATIRRQLVPKILAPVGAFDRNRMTSRVEVVEYNPIGQAPTLTMPDGRWMAQFEAGMNRSESEMGDRAGQQDVSQGKAASTAAAASIMALQEADETKLAISTRELNHSIQDLGLQVLMLVKQFWDEERTVRTWSRDGQLEVAQFSAADIGDQLDVHVSAESALPRSKSARTQLAIDLQTAGLITDPRHFVRMLDLPGTDFLVETLNLDTKQAEREHGHLLEMEPVVARVWHNHQAHVSTHDEFRKSEEYERLSPEQQAWFDGHVQAHVMIMASLAAAQQPPNGVLPNGQPAPAPGQNPSGANGENIDPVTGKPQDPNSLLGGMVPTQLQGGLASQAPGIGGAGNAGAVPGQSADSQSFLMGN